MGSSNKLYTISVIILLYFAAFASGGVYNSVALYLVIPCAFVITFFSTGATKVNRYYRNLMILYFWVFYAALFTTNLEPSIAQLKQILGCIIMCYIVAVQAKNEKTIPWLYIIYLITYVMSVNYVIENVIGVIEVGDERMEDDNMNANALAYSTFYATFILFILGEIIQGEKLRKLFRVLFWGIIPLFLWIAYVTASRQVMVIQIPLIAILIFLRYWKFGGNASRTLLVVMLCFVAPFVYQYVWSIFDNSLLIERSEDISNDARLVLIKETIDLGFHNFLVGVGPGCVKLYTSEQAFAHNSYLELFAGTGFIGMVIFIVLLCKYLAAQVRRYIAYRDKAYLYFAVFGIFFIIDQIFYVFYADLYLISFFILVATHSETYHQKRMGVNM